MMPASKHGDPQLGIDIHLCLVPPSPSPVPLPTPHLSVVFDPFDYVPYLGATVTVCGMKRATAGTNGMVVHIPPGFPFAPKLPDKDDELFMGSSTVVADGDPFSYIALPVLSCQIAGMINPFRLRKKGGPKIGVLPLTFNLAIPTSVFLGGAPTISLMGMAFKGAFAALGKLAKMGVFKRLRQKLFKNMKPGFLKCSILRAEPVNILNGEVSMDQIDFVLPGRLPIEWLRSYGSGSDHEGVCGRGWQTLLDIRLEVDPVDGSVQMHGPQLGPLWFERLPTGPSWVALELADGARLTEHHDEYRVATKDDRVYHFPKRPPHEGPTMALPIGRISDRCGNVLAFERDPDGRPTGLVDASGRRLVCAFEHGRLAAVTLHDPETDREHAFVRYEYDAAGELAAAIDALDGAYRYAYEARHLVRHTDRNGLSFHYAYEDAPAGERRVVHAWGDGGLHDYRFEYADALNERRITDAFGQVSRVVLDERGLPISEIDALGGMTIYEYDEAGRTTSVTDPDGQRSAFAYDERGNLVLLTRADATTIATRFDADDKPEAVTDPNGAIWQQRWDARGLLVEQTSPLGHVSRYEHDRLGQMSARIDPRGGRTQFGYDDCGSLTRLTDALGRQTLFAYDTLGNLVARGDPLDRRTHYRYDAKCRLVEVRMPSGSGVQCGYDAEDNLIRHVDENGAQTRLEYVGQGEVARRIQPDGQVLEFLHDAEERLVGVRNQRGETHAIRRDALGRVVEEIDYWGQARQYRYSAAGHIARSIDALGRAIDYATDPLGRVLLKSTADPLGGALPEQESFAYDANGNLTEAANAHVALTREFDLEGRLLGETQRHADGAVFTVQSRYDESGNRTLRRSATAHGPAHTVAFAYDLLDRAVALRIDDGASRNMRRDGAGCVIEDELAPGLLRHRRYDVDGRLTAQALSKEQQTLFGTGYAYDPCGNLTERQDSEHGVDRFLYDPMGRILEHADPLGGVRRFVNDPAGDRLVAQPVPPVSGDDAALDVWRREGSCEGATYRFDRAGNLVGKTRGTLQLDLQWNAEQRLLASRQRGAPGHDAPERITHYAYDPLGRRLHKETAGRRTRFGWDGDALACDTFDGRLREFVHAPGGFEPLAMLADAQVLHYVNDPNGCPMRLVDGSGRTRWAVSYAAWGGIDRLHSHEVDNPLRLQGQYADAETGLHYNRRRYYDSDAGSFVSQDPIGLAGGANVYEFAPNVLGWIDPWGLACGPAVRRNKAGRWIDAQGKFAKKPPVPNFVAESARHEAGIAGTTKGFHAHGSPNPVNGAGVTVPKSKFGAGEGGGAFSQEIYDHADVRATHQGNGRVSYEVGDIGRDTGTNQAGGVVRGGQVIVEGNPALNPALYNPGEVVTQYPK